MNQLANTGSTERGVLDNTLKAYRRALKDLKA